MPQAAAEFWNEVFAKGRADAYSRVEMPDLADSVLNRALTHFGEVRGKTLIDIGCGRGSSSLFFAHHGARVISVDTSIEAIRNLSAYCAAHGIDSITPLVRSGVDIGTLGRAHFVFGSMILHHLEPFAQFASGLKAALVPGGRAFFWENNARSRTMIWFRRYVVGKLWVPKHGDDEEFPLTPGEVEELGRNVRVTVEHPELLLFRMIALYLLRGHAMRPFAWLDDTLYRFPAIRRYSYRQYLLVDASS